MVPQAIGSLPFMWWSPSSFRHLQSMRSEGRLSKEDYKKFGEEFRAEALVFIKEFREEVREEQKLYEVIWGNNIVKSF